MKSVILHSKNGSLEL